MGASQESPLNILVQGAIETALNPGLVDKPDQFAYKLDTHNFLTEAEILGIFNRHNRVFSVSGTGSVNISGDTVIGGNVSVAGDINISGAVLAAPLQSPHFSSLATWHWVHGRGYKPLVEVIDDTAVEMVAKLQHVDDNTIQVEHTYGASGYIRIR